MDAKETRIAVAIIAALSGGGSFVGAQFTDHSSLEKDLILTSSRMTSLENMTREKTKEEYYLRPKIDEIYKRLSDVEARIGSCQREIERNDYFNPRHSGTN